MISLCALTPRLYDLPLRRAIVDALPYNPDSVSNSSTPLSLNFLPMTDKKFKAIMETAHTDYQILELIWMSPLYFFRFAVYR